MASSRTTVDRLLAASAAAGDVTARKMFGKYCVYLDSKPVGVVCDDRFFLKPTAAGDAVLPDSEEASPYPNAKPHRVVPTELWDDGELMAALLRTTFDALPAPKPRKKRRRAG